MNSLFYFSVQNYLSKNKLIDQIELLIYKRIDINTIYRNIGELSPNLGSKVGDNNDLTLIIYEYLYNGIKLIEMFINKKNINYVNKYGKNFSFLYIIKTK